MLQVDNVLSKLSALTVNALIFYIHVYMLSISFVLL